MPTLTLESSSPKYAQLASQLKAQIENGQLKPGDRLPSFSEMRSRFGATPSTVERVFATLERDNLIERVQGRGTFVADWKTFSLPVSGQIGFTVSSQTVRQSPYWAHLLAGLQEVAAQKGLQIVMMGKAETLQDNWKNLQGILFCDSRSELMAEIAASLAPQTPCVSLLFPVAGIASVLSDDFGGAKAATEHLLELGHQNIACLTGGEDAASANRRAGYRAALRSIGLVPSDEWVRNVTSPRRGNANFLEMGLETMRQWLQTDWRDLGCTAIVCQNDETAIGVLQALREAGLGVPNDVSLVGFDGTEAGTFCSPRLTSVALPLEEIGAAGLELLLEGGSGTIVLPTRLIHRDSTALAP